jgi:hypothetical protein
MTQFFRIWNGLRAVSITIAITAFATAAFLEAHPIDIDTHHGDRVLLEREYDRTQYEKARDRVHEGEASERDHEIKAEYEYKNSA